NPKITGGTGAGAADAVVTIKGNYVTFDGIDIANGSTASANAMMEYGYLITGSAATVGAQNNTVKNCTITLTNTNTNVNYGIYQLSIATSAAGENNNNTYNNVTINNAGGGIYIFGKSTSFPDAGCQIQNCAIGSAGADNITFPATNTNLPIGLRADNTT